MNRILILIAIGVASGLVGATLVTAAFIRGSEQMTVPLERTVCLPGPGEIASMDHRGLCVITKGKQVVTRMQLSRYED